MNTPIAYAAVPLLFLLGGCAAESERWEHGESVREMIRNQIDDPAERQPREPPGAPSTREQPPEPDMIEAGNLQHAI